MQEVLFSQVAAHLLLGLGIVTGDSDQTAH